MDDSNESSVVIENNNNFNINQEFIKNTEEANTNIEIDKNENKKLNNENIEKLIPLNDELFHYHEDSMKKDIEGEDDNIYNYKDNDINENRNYVITSSGESKYKNISEKSFHLLRNEIICNHRINVISEESENDEIEDDNNKYSNNNIESKSKMNENNNKENDNIVEENGYENINESDINSKYVNSPIEDNELKKDYSNGSLSFIKKEFNINKDLNDNESFNFETTSIADNKSIATNSVYSLNKESIENINDNHNNPANNDALLLQSVDFSRSKINYGYNNDFDYLLNIKRAEEFIKTYKVDMDDESSKKFLLFKPFYTIANGIISKQLSENEHFSGSSFYTSHAGYINLIKKKVTLDFIWNNNITQIYFLMYLIHKDPELSNIFFFYVDADNFRINSPYTVSTVRKQQAQKIFEDYFASLSDTFIDWKYFLNKIPVSILFKRLKNQVDSGTSIMFDDYLFFAMLIMEKVFYGEEIISHKGELKRDKKNKNSSSNNITIIDSFENSVFYQEMINDSIFDSYVASTINMKRAAERILNMPINYFGSITNVKKISKFLIRIGVDKQVVSNSKLMQQIKFKGKEGSIKQKMKHPRTQSDLLTLFGKNEQSASQKLSRSLSVKENDNERDDSKNEVIQMQTNYNYQPEGNLTINHVFVKYTDKKFSFCEYCFDDKQISKKDFKSLYQCETCNMIVHKCCRKLVMFDCMDNNKSIFDQYEGNDEEIIIKIQERIKAINNEIKVEESIQNGAKKVIELSSKSSSGQNPNSILEQSIKKVNVLKNELNKNTMYLNKLETKIKEKQEQLEKNKIEDSLSKEINVEFIKDEKTIETKIKIQESHTTTEVILNLLSKLKLSGKYNDYTLNYLSKNHNLIELMYTESPIKNVIDIENVKFILKNINKGNKRDIKDSYNFEKRLNVANEIHETEKNYLQKLIQIKVFFIEPMTESKIFSEESINKIFGNILNIIEHHKDMVKSLNDLWKKIDDIIELEEKLVKIYIDMLPKISPEYCEYCSNRAIGDEYLLNLYNEDPKTKKFISECENNNKVALDKLSLKDLLIEPMHRITRYSILFKRLSGYINYPPHTINTFLSKIEEETKKINIAVGEMDSKQKVIKLEKLLDWNNIFYKFNINCSQRKLLNAQEFNLIDKYGHSSKVTVYAFNDLLLVTKIKKSIPVLCIPPITYECLNIIDCIETAESDFENLIQIIHNQHNVYLLQSTSRLDKKNWLNNIGLIKISFCLSLYMSKNQPTILLKYNEESNAVSESSYDDVSITSVSKRNFFTSFFDRSINRRMSSSSSINRKLSTTSLEQGKSKNMFLGRRFSMSNNNRSNSFYKTGTRESSTMTMPEAISNNSLNNM